MHALALTALLFAAADDPTPAEVRIRQALAAIERAPADARRYSSLAFAFARRARETADSELYERALSATDVALALAPDDFEARKQRAWALLGLHRWSEALALASALNREAPDDLAVYGYLVDAHVELGQYEAAEEACQWMLDLRPGSVPALTRAAYLRELFGDLDGALQLMLEAYPRVPSLEREDRAWILTHIGHLHRIAGRLPRAAEALEGALALFPDYHYALAQLAHVHAAEGDAATAVELYERRHAAAPHPENLFELAAALEAAGRSDAAAEAFARFERDALAESDGLDNANRELVLYYADHAEDPAEALRIAALERARRADVWTRDAHAWALAAAGRVDEAAEEIEAVLAVGVADPALLFRAGAIAAAAGHPEVAAERLRGSLGRDPGSGTAARARALLVALEKN